MRLKITSFLFLVTTICFFSCKDQNSTTPYIEFVSISDSYMTQGGLDSLYLKFKFTDGDGNIGSDTNDNIFVSDSRTGAIIASYKIPNYLGVNPNNSSRTGEVTLVVYSQCCIYPNGSSCQSSTTYPTRTMNYKVQIQDQAGNYSNVIETDEVTLDCL
ncbi:hypothetical protein [Aureispira anguillae]|uniref:Uncharacterized protein n=1 Tax=Aureispira anguillae TaxID=2864201 RepID=A0A916DS43_9BACT|nr:hypothetical protein [Aureispira anguillae]BDS12264.1 hypothetical protein AsAng_0029830 [Aureispira anguillae]